MLLRFEVSNYRSILDPVELSMIAVDEDRAATRGFDHFSERVLTVAGIYAVILEIVTDSGVTLRAEKRRYAAGGQVMTEAGIAAGFTRDLYVALGEPLPDGSWGVRINDKPLVRWVWLGALLMAAGGVLAVLDRRYRRLGRRARPSSQSAAPAAGAQAIT